MTTMDGALESVLDAYVQAWNEPDAGYRRALLERSLSDDCVFEGPLGALIGRDAVDRLIVAMQDRMPGTNIVRVGAPEQGEEVAFRWEVRTSAGERLMSGVDTVSVAGDGRLRKIVLVADPATR